MTRAASRPSLALAWLLLIALGQTAFADVPVVPFSGVYGSTAGAGSLAGWERHGGDNPAVFGGPGVGVSVAGYSPFGLEELRVLETSAVWDRAAWGSSLAWRALFADDRHRASVTRSQWALKFAQGWSGGGSVAVKASDGTPAVGVGLGLGILWRPWSGCAVGAAYEHGAAFSGEKDRVGIGGDVGGRLGRSVRAGSAWRFTAEGFFDSGGLMEWRYGFGFRFHPLLSAYAGFAPKREMAALGVRFGMGGFEGFSALRRHAALGGTSIQGLQWNGKGLE